MKAPPRWTDDELAQSSAAAIELFRQERLTATDTWKEQCFAASKKFEQLFEKLGNLAPGAVTDERLADACRAQLLDSLRYLAGPPISEDDLAVLANVSSTSPGVLAKDADALRAIYSVISEVVDPLRLPWVAAGRHPTAPERSAAILASAALLAAQRIATERRNDGKDAQERKVKEYLVSLGFAEVPTARISTLLHGPQQGQFCAECQFGDRKADIVVRLPDTRLMAIECKVSNSATNSVKRLNNDAAVKAEYWLKTFGTSQVVPVAMLAGVFKVLNLRQAQERGLALFWSHDLGKLGEFITGPR